MTRRGASKKNIFIFSFDSKNQYWYHNISGFEYQDPPPSYEHILEMERCPEYEELNLEMDNSPEINEELKTHELNRLNASV